MRSTDKKTVKGDQTNDRREGEEQSLDYPWGGEQDGKNRLETKRERGKKWYVGKKLIRETTRKMEHKIGRQSAQWTMETEESSTTPA